MISFLFKWCNLQLVLAVQCCKAVRVYQCLTSILNFTLPFHRRNLHFFICCTDYIFLHFTSIIGIISCHLLHLPLNKQMPKFVGSWSSWGNKKPSSTQFDRNISIWCKLSAESDPYLSAIKSTKKVAQCPLCPKCCSAIENKTLMQLCVTPRKGHQQGWNQRDIRKLVINMMPCQSGLCHKSQYCRSTLS